MVAESQGGVAFPFRRTYRRLSSFSKLIDFVDEAIGQRLIASVPFSYHGNGNVGLRRRDIVNIDRDKCMIEARTCPGTYRGVFKLHEQPNAMYRAVVDLTHFRKVEDLNIAGAVPSQLSRRFVVEQPSQGAGRMLITPDRFPEFIIEPKLIWNAAIAGARESDSRKNHQGNRDDKNSEPNAPLLFSCWKNHGATCLRLSGIEQF